MAMSLAVSAACHPLCDATIWLQPQRTSFINNDSRSEGEEREAYLGGISESSTEKQRRRN